MPTVGAGEGTEAVMSCAWASADLGGAGESAELQARPDRQAHKNAAITNPRRVRPEFMVRAFLSRLGKIKIKNYCAVAAGCLLTRRRNPTRLTRFLGTRGSYQFCIDLELCGSLRAWFLPDISLWKRRIDHSLDSRQSGPDPIASRPRGRFSPGDLLRVHLAAKRAEAQIPEKAANSGFGEDSQGSFDALFSTLFLIAGNLPFRFCKALPSRPRR
jgi:hypothetical protein